MTSDDYLRDPLLIQQSLLSSYESNLEEGTVVDTNNAFMFVLESVSNIAAHIARKIDDNLIVTYPKRADNTDSLYNHISDYGHIGFFSFPSTLSLKISLDKDYILKNAVPVPGANYSKMVIPENTVFNVGPYVFGIHYPIEVRAVPAVKSITVVYDTTNDNPLKVLDTNIITNYESNINGITLTSFEIPVEQFVKNLYEESITPSIGFKKTYNFTGKFYAIKVTSAGGSTKFVNDIDLALTMSDKIYDVKTPTCIFRVFPESNEVSVTIPKIYFKNNVINTKIRIEVLTTSGELNVNISNLDLTDVSATFNVPKHKASELKYTSILDRIPTIALQPTSTRIVGGSNGMSFDEMKNSVLYSTSSSVPITRNQIQQFFDVRGYTGVLKVDNITDRVYYAYKRVEDKGSSIGVVNSTLTMRLNSDPFNYSSDVRNSNILLHREEHIVVLPGTIFSCNKSTSGLSLLTDSEVLALKVSPPADIIKRLSEELITIYPYHLSCIKTDNYIRARSYDLFDTGISNVIFERENLSLNAQLTLVVGNITHLENGRGGYRARLGFVMTEDLRATVNDLIKSEINLFGAEGISEADATMLMQLVVNRTITVEVNVMTDYGTLAKFDTSFYGFHNELAVFDIIIKTGYVLEDESIDILDVNFKTGNTRDTRIKLNGLMNVIPSVDASLFPRANYDSVLRNKLVKPDSDFLAMSHQTFNYKLGVLIDDVVDNNLYLGWEGNEYEKYSVDVPFLYESPVYETDDDGNLVYTIIEDDGEYSVITNIVPGKDKGDPVTDEEGLPVFRYRVGDPILGVDQRPIIKSKSLSYTVDITTVDYRHYLTTPDFFNAYTEVVRAYFEPVREISSSLLEETEVYMREIDTLTTAKFRINDITEIKLSPDLSFEFKTFVPDRVFEDTSLMISIKESIQEIVESHITKTIISISYITKEIIEVLGDYITAIDGISINGNPNIQTLVTADATRVARLGYELKLSDTNDYYLEPAIDFNIQILNK